MCFVAFSLFVLTIGHPTTSIPIGICQLTSTLLLVANATAFVAGVFTAGLSSSNSKPIGTIDYRIVGVLSPAEVLWTGREHYHTGQCTEHAQGAKRANDGYACEAQKWK